MITTTCLLYCNTMLYSLEREEFSDGELLLGLGRGGGGGVARGPGIQFISINTCVYMFIYV